MILVCGEALIDLFLDPVDGATVPARGLPGGSPYNVAVGLSRFGVPSSFFGALSTDVLGGHLAAGLIREGVDLRHVLRVANPTTLSVVATDSAGIPAYAFYGTGSADRQVRSDALPELDVSVSALTFGSFSLGVEPCGSAYLDLAQREHGRRVISLDPNVRPGIVGDIAAWRARFEAFLSCATIVKASTEDIALGWGKDADPDTIARSWLARGPALVTLTRCENGAVAYHGGRTFAMGGRAVVVSDTVGAGDTFHAALLARLYGKGKLSLQGVTDLTGQDIADVMTHAIAASALTCTRRGADLPRADEVAAFLASATK